MKPRPNAGATFSATSSIATKRKQTALTPINLEIHTAAPLHCLALCHARTGEVLGAIADLAMRRKSGARGLRAILEGIMLDVMYDLPSATDVEECLISEEVVTKGMKPLLVYGKQKESA